jgi:hypothetical protein
MQYSGNSSKRRNNIEVLFLSEIDESLHKKLLVEDTNREVNENDTSNQEDDEEDRFDTSADWYKELTEEEIDDTDYTDFSSLSTIKKGIPLERVLDKYCSYNFQTYGIEFKNVCNIRNYKNGSGKQNLSAKTIKPKSKNHEVDFIIYDRALIECKNLDCVARHYSLRRRDVYNKIVLKFKKYSSELKRIVIISDPVWEGTAKEYVQQEGIFLIELHFIVTYSQTSQDIAFEIIKEKLDTILDLPISAINGI